MVYRSAIQLVVYAAGLVCAVYEWMEEVCAVYDNVAMMRARCSLWQESGIQTLAQSLVLYVSTFSKTSGE